MILFLIDFKQLGARNWDYNISGTATFLANFFWLSYENKTSKPINNIAKMD